MVQKLFLFVLLLLAAVPSTAQEKSRKKSKKSVYEQVDFEGMIQRYLNKEVDSHSAIEGIYTVSCVITTRKKRLLSTEDRVKVVERKDNYARVAVIKDWPFSTRDFIEVSLNASGMHYPVVGELKLLSEGRGMIYKHIEPDGTFMSFSMTYLPTDLLEGEHSFTKKRKMVTYKISYLKVYPKTPDFIVGK